MGCVTCVLFAVFLILVLFRLYLKLTTGWCTSNVCLVGKTAIVTGANTGIGYETAEDFAKRGAKVILACRDTRKAEDAVKKIINATGNNNVSFQHLDLCDFKSVRNFAESFTTFEDRLDILVNNAGLADGTNEKTENGFLKLMQTNYFGPFLLTNLLLGLLKKTPSSRIVNVSSIAAKYCRSYDVNNLNQYPDDRSSPSAALYSRSKLCNILFTIELANRLKGTGVTTYSVHPGVVQTDIFRSAPRYIKLALDYGFCWLLKSSLEGAQTTIYCSVAKEITDLSGQHFQDCKVVKRYRVADDPDAPRRLWKVTEKLYFRY